jgi:hypothetical protein
MERLAAQIPKPRINLVLYAAHWLQTQSSARRWFATRAPNRCPKSPVDGAVQSMNALPRPVGGRFRSTRHGGPPVDGRPLTQRTRPPPMDELLPKPDEVQRRDDLKGADRAVSDSRMRTR